MIERLLAAEEALRTDELEVAERLFTQVADADARNAIALVGLARIAARRGETDTATATLRRALEIDPDEAAAIRLLRQLEAESVPATTIDTPLADAPVAPVADAPVAPAPAGRPSLLDRIRRWLGLSGDRR